MADYDEVRAECEAQPGFNLGTAYTRTKLCCQILLRRGEAIPSWMVLREIIGRGSSGDISRGVKDFRREHADRLRRVDGSMPGVPAQLAPIVSSLWDAAMAAASAEFAAKAEHWRVQVEQAEARADQVAQQLADSQAVTARQRSQIEVLDAGAVALQAQLGAEQAARGEAERLFRQQAAEMSAQRDKLDAALRENQAEMQKALERFDGERRYAMVQIDEARTRAAREVEEVRALAQREKSALERDIARLSDDLAELRRSAGEAERQAAVATQVAAGLRESLGRAEASNDRLTEDNRRMVALIKGGTTVKTSRLRPLVSHSAARRRKRG